MSGRAHDVCTSVFICHLAKSISTSFSEISRVHFQKLSRDKIDNYFERVNPLESPFVFKWRHGSRKPWDWKLTRVSNEGLELPASSY